LAGTAKNLVSTTKALEKSAKDIAAKKTGRTKSEPATYESDTFSFDRFDFGSLETPSTSAKKKWNFREGA
jgi:hypothetical protein